MTDEQIGRLVVEGGVALIVIVQTWLTRRQAEAAEKKADSADRKADQVLQAVQQINNRLQQIQSQAVNVHQNVYYSGTTSGTAETLRAPTDAPPPLVPPEQLEPGEEPAE